MPKISKKIPASEFNAIYNGNNFLELQVISNSKGSSKLNVLISGNILLRVEKKNKTKIESSFINHAFIEGIVSKKDLVHPKSSTILKNILKLDKQIKDKINESIQKLHAGDEHGFKGFYRNIESRWEEIEKFQKKLGLNLLREDRISYCNECNAFRSGAGFSLQTTNSSTPATCEKCHKPIKKTKMIKNLPDPIRRYIDGGWLEDYVARKLDKLGWKVWSHIYVYGTSGVRLEIDVLAIKNGYTLIVECKSGDTETKDLSTFLAKFNDIKTNLALFISPYKIGSQIKHLVKKNFAFHLYDDIKNDRDLESKLKTLLK